MVHGSTYDLLSFVSEPVLITTSDGVVCFANDAVHTLAGWFRPMVGMPIRTIAPEWDFDIAIGRRTRPVKSTIRHMSGPPVPVELAMASWNEDGHRFIGAVIGLTAEREAAEAVVKRDQDRMNAALAEVRLANRRLEQVIETLPQAVCVFDAEDRYVLWNHRYAQLYAHIAHALRPGVPFVDILRMSLDSGQQPEKVDDVERWLSERMTKHARPAWREEQEWHDGRWILHDDRRMADGGAIGMRIDISDMKRREASFRLLFQSNPVPMLLFESGSLRIVDVNDAATALYGFSRDAFLARTLADLHDEGERAAAERTFQTLGDTYEDRTIWHHRAAADRTMDVLIFVRTSAYENRRCFLAAIVDVSDRIRAEAQLAHVAHHDPTTGLANRIRFRAVAEAALAAVAGGDMRRVVVHCLDLDGFKPVNDTFGHAAGDSLLKIVGERLQAVAGRDDLVARLGGDEFAVLQTDALEEAESFAERLLSSLTASFRIGTNDVRIGASLGHAIAPRDGTDLDLLLGIADAALYADKAGAGRRPNWMAPERRRRVRTG